MGRLARPKPPLSVPPPRKTRFGSPLISRIHWVELVEPKLVAKIAYLTWTADGATRAIG
jgi:hypothetical protein